MTTSQLHEEIVALSRRVDLALRILRLIVDERRPFLDAEIAGMLAELDMALAT